jgi:hypothetical protein
MTAPDRVRPQNPFRGRAACGTVGICKQRSTTLSWYCFTPSTYRKPADRRPECGEIPTVADPLFGLVVCAKASPNEGAES